MSKRDIKQEVTDRIVAALEDGTAPWVRGWSGGTNHAAPRNAATGRSYNGVNIMLLWLSAAEQGFASDEWMTYKQAQKLGGQVRKGEKGTMVVFWKILKKSEENDDGEIVKKSFPLLRHYTVFNREQVDGLPEVEEVEVTEAERHERAEALIAATGAKITYGDARAYYSPSTDSIALPAIEQFEHESEFYSTSFHELSHWTGHKSRLDRELSCAFGSESYAREELVAELSAAFVCAEVGIQGKLQHAEYIGSWIKLMKSDKHALFAANSRAKKAADFLLAFEGEEEAQEAA